MQAGLSWWPQVASCWVWTQQMSASNKTSKQLDQNFLLRKVSSVLDQPGFVQLVLKWPNCVNMTLTLAEWNSASESRHATIATTIMFDIIINMWKLFSLAEYRVLLHVFFWSAFKVYFYWKVNDFRLSIIVRHCLALLHIVYVSSNLPVSHCCSDCKTYHWSLGPGRGLTTHGHVADVDDPQLADIGDDHCLLIVQFTR